MLLCTSVSVVKSTALTSKLETIIRITMIQFTFDIRPVHLEQAVHGNIPTLLFPYQTVDYCAVNTIATERAHPLHGPGKLELPPSEFNVKLAFFLINHDLIHYQLQLVDMLMFNPDSNASYFFRVFKWLHHCMIYRHAGSEAACSLIR